MPPQLFTLYYSSFINLQLIEATVLLGDVLVEQFIDQSLSNGILVEGLLLEACPLLGEHVVEDLLDVIRSVVRLDGLLIYS